MDGEEEQFQIDIWVELSLLYAEEWRIWLKPEADMKFMRVGETVNNQHFFTDMIFF